LVGSEALPVYPIIGKIAIDIAQISYFASQKAGRVIELEHRGIDKRRYGRDNVHCATGEYFCECFRKYGYNPTRGKNRNMSKL